MESNMNVARSRPKEQTNSNQHELAKAMARVETVVGRYFPEALDSVRAALAVCAVGCFSDNSQPTAVHLVGSPGAGKTLPLEFMMPEGDDDPLAECFYRSDNFTAASFVSHKADDNDETLRKIDLLPKIKDKTLLTPELSPLFRGRRDDLVKTFGILTRVLDGQGYQSDSGAHGRRGYAGPHNFQWLGATTPLSLKALTVMGELGPRIFFYAADRPRKDVQQLYQRLRGLQRGKIHEESAKRKCRAAVRNFLIQFSRTCPPGSFSSTAVACADRRLQELATWAEAVTKLRAVVTKDKKNRLHVVSTEYPERILKVLRNITLASALIRGESKVKRHDLAQIAHIAMSSGVPGRGKVLSATLDNGGAATTPEVQRLTQMSTPTALRYMRELGAVGLVHFSKRSPVTIELSEEFSALTDAPRLKPKGVGGSRST